MGKAIWLAVLMMAAPLRAEAPVSVESAVFLEAGSDSRNGHARNVGPASRFHTGDRVVTILRWDAPVQGSYTLVTSVPKGLSIRSASREGLEYSSDGGRMWRRAPDARNLPRGITHLRWRAGPGEGRLSYRAVVL